MKSSTLSLIGIALPRSQCRSSFGIEYRDTEDKLIGYVQSDIFYLNRKYKYYALANKSLNERGVETQDWDEAEALYQKK